MSSAWLVSISIKDWNSLVKDSDNSNVINNSKVAVGDYLCIYVRESSSFKGIAKLDSMKKLQFEKFGDLNYFGVADSLEFVKDKDDVVKYLKNFSGIANLGKPIPAGDLEFISEQLIPSKKSQEVIEPQIQLKGNYTIGSDYEMMFKLENALRKFVVAKLKEVSKNWIKERAPDQEAVQKWKDRYAEHNKHNKWFHEQDHNLIEFSDFLDLLTLIISRKNWKECFEEAFGHRAIFEGKMIELGNIRNNIAHNRELGQEEKEALDLYSRQIYRLIGKQ